MFVSRVPFERSVPLALVSVSHPLCAPRVGRGGVRGWSQGRQGWS